MLPLFLFESKQRGEAMKKVELRIIIDKFVFSSFFLSILNEEELGHAIKYGEIITNTRRAKKIILQFVELAMKAIQEKAIDQISIKEGSVEVFAFNQLTKHLSFYEAIIWNSEDIPLKKLKLKEKEVRYANIL